MCILKYVLCCFLEYPHAKPGETRRQTVDTTLTNRGGGEGQKVITLY